MAEDSEEKPKNFHEMELDNRILKAIAKLGWQAPTLIQERAIPLLLEGKDVLVRARTGSGKTAAFAIPVIQKILTLKQTAKRQEIKALILAPSKELCNQICGVVQDLTIKCSQEVRCVNVAPPVELGVQKPLLVERPDIVVGTPTRVLKHVKAGYLDLKKSMELLVIDEADLVFSFGYESEVKELMEAYKFKLDEVEAFKYRAKDAWRAVTRIAVREARLKEIKQEIFNCQKLKNYFEDNPTDLQVLRHDKALHTVRIQQHLSDVPEYIVPPTLKGMTGLSKKNKRKRDSYQTSQASSKRFQAKKSNPLLSMDFEGFSKKKRKKN
ncbi:hypothetical protein GEV33_001061 [Tenebrio molitor]|uniref:RNA helicase n=1 Tax=Tenebrio molitor TaxID=7067 RepID=A0A8J6HVZ9_TENMO|nr:hypothetical protein GEV33_001061 [Tenebrio molitor]